MDPVSNLSTNVQPLTQNGKIFFDYLATKVNEVVIKMMSIIGDAHMNRSEFLKAHIRPAEKNIAESKLDERLQRLLNHLTYAIEQRFDEIDSLTNDPKQKFSALFGPLDKDEHEFKLGAAEERLVSIRQKIMEHLKAGNSEAPAEMVEEFKEAQIESRKWTNGGSPDTRRILIQNTVLPIVQMIAQSYPDLNI